jgi:DNA polymerase-3 subunit delta
LTPEQVLEQLSQGPPEPVYYLFGPETFFMDRVLELVLERAFPGGDGRDLNYHILAGKEIKGEAVVREARTMPMFSPLRVLLLRQVHMALASELEPLVGYVKAPSPSTCLLLFSTGKVDGRTTFGRALSQKAVIVECRHPFESQLPPILQRMARQRQVELGPEVVGYLVEVVGSDLLALDDAVERLRLFAGERRKIDLETARKCIADTRVHEIWDLTDAIGNRDLEQALKVLGRLRSEGTEALRLLPMMARSVRQLLTARALGQDKLKPDAVAKALGIPPFLARNVAQQARRFSTEDLARAMKALHRADLSLKSSEFPAGVRDWVVLEELVWSLTKG